MKTKLMVLMFLAGGSIFAAPRFSVGVNVGGFGGYYTPAPVYGPAIPPCPGPGYVWANGYWNPPVYNNYRNDRRDFDRDDHGHDYRRSFNRGSDHDRNFRDRDDRR